MLSGIHRHAAAMGLPVASEQDLREYAASLAPGGIFEGRDDDGGRIIWRDPSGVGLSILTDHAHTIECIIPFYSGSPRAQAAIHKLVEDPHCRFCDRLVVRVLDPRGEAQFPLALPVHDLGSSRPDIEFGLPMKIALTAFADPMVRTEPDPNGVGCWPAERDRERQPQPQLRLRGEVTSSELRSNRATGNMFHYVRVSAGSLDVDVIAPATGDRDPGFPVGQYVDGNFFVVGALEPERHEETMVPGRRSLGI